MRRATRAQQRIQNSQWNSPERNTNSHNKSTVAVINKGDPCDTDNKANCCKSTLEKSTKTHLTGWSPLVKIFSKSTSPMRNKELHPANKLALVSTTENLKEECISKDTMPVKPIANKRSRGRPRKQVGLVNEQSSVYSEHESGHCKSSSQDNKPAMQLNGKALLSNDNLQRAIDDIGDTNYNNTNHKEREYKNSKVKIVEESGENSEFLNSTREVNVQKNCNEISGDICGEQMANKKRNIDPVDNSFGEQNRYSTSVCKDGTIITATPDKKKSSMECSLQNIVYTDHDTTPGNEIQTKNHSSKNNAELTNEDKHSLNDNINPSAVTQKMNTYTTSDSVSSSNMENISDTSKRSVRIQALDFHNLEMKELLNDFDFSNDMSPLSQSPPNSPINSNNPQAGNPTAKRRRGRPRKRMCSDSVSDERHLPIKLRIKLREKSGCKKDAREKQQAKSEKVKSPGAELIPFNSSIMKDHSSPVKTRPTTTVRKIGKSFGTVEGNNDDNVEPKDTPSKRKKEKAVGTSLLRLEKQACILWSSEQRRRFQQEFQDFNSEQLDDVMREHWNKLTNKEKLRYCQRAQDALEGRRKQSERRPRKQRNERQRCESESTSLDITAMVTGALVGQDYFNALTSNVQYELLKNKLQELQLVLNRNDYIEFISNFKSSFRSTCEASKIKTKDHSDSVSRRLLYSMIREIEPRLNAIRTHRMSQAYYQYCKDYEMFLWKLISGEKCFKNTGKQSRKLSETIYDLQKILIRKEFASFQTTKSSLKKSASFDALVNYFKSDSTQPKQFHDIMICNSKEKIEKIRNVEMEKQILRNSLKFKELPELNCVDVEQFFNKCVTDTSTPAMTEATFECTTDVKTDRLLMDSPKSSELFTSPCYAMNSPSCVLNEILSLTVKWQNKEIEMYSLKPNDNVTDYELNKILSDQPQMRSDNYSLLPYLSMYALDDHATLQHLGSHLVDHSYGYSSDELASDFDVHAE